MISNHSLYSVSLPVGNYLCKIVWKIKHIFIFWTFLYFPGILWIIYILYYIYLYYIYYIILYIFVLYICIIYILKYESFKKNWRSCYVFDGLYMYVDCIIFLIYKANKYRRTSPTIVRNAHFPTRCVYAYNSH